MSLNVTGTSTRFIYAPGNIQPFSGVKVLDSLFASGGAGSISVTITVTDINGGPPTDAAGIFIDDSYFHHNAPGVYTYSVTSRGAIFDLVSEPLAQLTFKPTSTPSTALMRLDVADSSNQTASDFKTSVVNAIPPTSFTISDQTTSLSRTSTGTGYVGPVAGLQRQYYVQTDNPAISTHNLNITAVTPNVFIHSGSGMDGVDVSRANGNNIIDAGTGSNFLIGGTGNDIFYLDNRAPDSPIFSTIKNFHTGDSATVWGVNATDFKITQLENQGAPGSTGLDLIFSAPGHVDTSFVLAGYTAADLTNGRLSLSYGRTPDITGLPGSQYLTVHAN